MPHWLCPTEHPPHPQPAPLSSLSVGLTPPGSSHEWDPTGWSRVTAPSTPHDVCVSLLVWPRPDVLPAQAGEHSLACRGRIWLNCSCQGTRGVCAFGFVAHAVGLAV